MESKDTLDSSLHLRNTGRHEQRKTPQEVPITAGLVISIPYASALNSSLMPPVFSTQYPSLSSHLLGARFLTSRTAAASGNKISRHNFFPILNVRCSAFCELEAVTKGDQAQ